MRLGLEMATGGSSGLGGEQGVCSAAPHVSPVQVHRGALEAATP